MDSFSIRKNIIEPQQAARARGRVPKHKPIKSDFDRIFEKSCRDQNNGRSVNIVRIGE